MKSRPLFVLHPFPVSCRSPFRSQCAPHMHAAPGLSAGEGVSRADWRSFRARLVRSEAAEQDREVTEKPHGEWAHNIAHVEVGCVLVSDPAYTWPKSFAHLNRAVVLITNIRNNAVSGLLLTRPTRYFVGDQASVLGRVGNEFKENILHLGGDTSMGSLEVLHAHPPSTVPGARELIPGISIGGLNASRVLVQSGVANAHDFHFFIAYARWNRVQLKAEIDSGAWIVAACSPRMLMESGLENPSADADTLWRKLVGLLHE